jgi:hypothetical protein
MMEMSGGIYPPPVETFPDSLRPYVARRGDSTARPDLRARYLDFIWVRWKDFDAARAAHAAYLDAGGEADLDDATSSMTAVPYFLRASSLAMRLNIDRPGTADRLYGEVLRGLERPQGGYSSWLARSAANLLASDRERCACLVDSFAAEAGNGASGRRTRERVYLEAAEDLARALGDQERVRSLRHDRARSFEAEARERVDEGGLIELALLEDAARLYGEAGSGIEVQRLKPELSAASARAVDATSGRLSLAGDGGVGEPQLRC